MKMKNATPPLMPRVMPVAPRHSHRAQAAAVPGRSQKNDAVCALPGCTHTVAQSGPQPTAVAIQGFCPVCHVEAHCVVHANTMRTPAVCALLATLVPCIPAGFTLEESSVVTLIAMFAGLSQRRNADLQWPNKLISHTNGITIVPGGVQPPDV
jgi:hypothetical protein